MAYYFKKELNLSFDESVETVIVALKKQGFGILTDIDVKKTLKEKLNVEFSNYRILGACNPSLALKALKAELDIGLLLPCNVVVYEKDGKVIVSFINPSDAFSIVDNQTLKPLAIEVEKLLKKTIDSL